MNRLKTILLVLAAFALLWAAGSRHAPLLEARRTYGLDHAEPLENAPPLIVFSTVALGGFSSLIADFLWVRAAQLQRDGQFFELVQLADWITKLQPRFPEGWVYHAWNLSYNVSVMFPNPEDRWRWVRHGVELLRDGGLRYNPRNPTLHRELGWLFQHKIGQSMDQAHMFYKYSWAMEMQMLFEGRGPDFDVMAATPATRTAVMAVPGIPELVEQLRSATFDPFTYQWPSPARREAFDEIVRSSAVGEVLLNHIRLRMLEDRYRLVPSIMQQVEAEIGPVDWRMPQAHAAYWAWRGKRYAEGFERLQLDRMVFQSMADAFRTGRFHFDPEEDVFVPAPNPDLLPYVMQAYEAAIAEHDPDMVRTAHINFLNHALTVVYTYNRISDAEMVFQSILEKYPEEIDGRSMDEYVISLFVERMEDLSDMEALAFVEGAFYQSYFWLALGESERAAGFSRLARRTWHQYMEPRMDNAEWAERTGLPPLHRIQRQALEQVRENITSRAMRERLRDADQVAP